MEKSLILPPNLTWRYNADMPNPVEVRGTEQWVAGGWDVFWDDMRIAHYPASHGPIEQLVTRDLAGLRDLAEFDRKLLAGKLESIMECWPYV